MTIDLNLIVSAVLGVLLVAMIVSAWRLNRKIEILRDGQGELRGLVDALNSATERAQGGIVQLRTAAKECEQELSKETSKARALADELALITAAGDDLADRLEKKLTAAPSRFAEQQERSGPKPPTFVSKFPKPAKTVPLRGGLVGDKEEQADPEIAQALRGVR
jgi:hypothetical protein